MPADSLAVRVARRVRELRMSRGWTQAQVSARAGMATNNLQRIESGQQNLTLSTIERLAHALDVEPAELLRDGKPRRKG